MFIAHLIFYLITQTKVCKGIKFAQSSLRMCLQPHTIHSFLHTSAFVLVYIQPTYHPHKISILCFLLTGSVGWRDWGTRRNSQSSLWLASQFLVLSKFEKLLLHNYVRFTGSYNRAVSRMCLRLPCLSGTNRCIRCLEMICLLHVVKIVLNYKFS